MHPKALSPLEDLWFAIRTALPRFIWAVHAEPSLLLRPAAARRLFFSYLWSMMGIGVEANSKDAREQLLRKNTRGTVLDIGAGYGPTLRYLDIEKVDLYVAVEPNPHMHAKLRETANSAGLPQSKIIIVAAGLEDLDAIRRALPAGSRERPIDTVVSVLTLCSIPSPEKVLPAFIRSFMAPGGKMLVYEHVAAEPEDDPDAIFWQKLWTPVWAWIFDGCRMDQRTFDIVKNVGGWSHHDIQRKPGEGKTLFCHWSGVFTREAEDQD